MPPNQIILCHVILVHRTGQLFFDNGQDILPLFVIHTYLYQRSSPVQTAGPSINMLEGV
jgi:hypothetical protein